MTTEEDGSGRPERSGPLPHVPDVGDDTDDSGDIDGSGSIDDPDESVDIGEPGDIDDFDESGDIGEPGDIDDSDESGDIGDSDESHVADGTTVPPVSGGSSGRNFGEKHGQAGAGDPDAKPIRYYSRPTSETTKTTETTEDGRRSADACRCDTACGCRDSADAASDSDTAADAAPESDAAADSATADSATAADSASPTARPDAVVDGGTRPSNVDGRGKLRDLEFTEPSDGKSQDVYDDSPDERVQVPDGVDLDTPGYSIREEMNDIETPDDKTWFMELDAAVIDEGRCIQCGTCVAACPSDSIGVGDDDLPKLVKMCTGCSLCWDFCPRGGLRYERQWKITGGEDNVSGAGDPITEFSARVEDDWRENAQDGGLVTAVLSHLLEAGEIDGALIATESDDEPWKAESFLATTPEECVENAGSFYNQTLALGNLDLSRWEHKLDGPLEEASLALVGTPCEIEGVRALQDFEWDYAAQEDGVRAIEYTIALMCTKNFNYYSLIGEQLEEKRDIPPEEIGKLDVLDGEMRVYDHDGESILTEDVENFHDATLKGCDECADFTGYCADLTVGSVGSSEEYSTVIVRTERGLRAWELTEPDLDYHDLENRGAVGGLQSWDKKKAFESLERPFDPDAPRFIEYTEHTENYGTDRNPHESDH